MDRHDNAPSPPDLRIAVVMGSNAPGGTETQTRLLITALIEHGVLVTVFLLDGSAGLDGLPGGTRVLEEARPPRWRSPFDYARMVLRLRALIRAGQFDVVHAVHARGYVAAALACLGLSVLKVTARRNTGAHLVGRWRVLSRAFEWFSLAVANVVVVNSQDVRDYWTTNFSVSSTKVVVVPNALAEWRFADPVEPLETGCRLLAVGGLKPLKGFNHLIEAAALAGAGPVGILGEGSERRALVARAQELGVALRLPGHVGDTRPWLKGADIVVHPSLSEGSSNAVAEAMAAGCAVIATDVGGTRELVGDTALVVEPGDVGALAGAIRELSGAPDLRYQLGQRARERARSRMGETALVAAMTAIYGGNLPCAE